jgi:hypothetical protein
MVDLSADGYHDMPLCPIYYSALNAARPPQRHPGEEHDPVPYLWAVGEAVLLLDAL